jgi:putative signal transducing protein
VAEVEYVRVTVVPGEPEAQALCEHLQQNGISCAFRPTNEDDSAWEGFGGEGGEREILVGPADLEAARALLNEH